MLYRLARPLLFCLDPESAHRAGLTLLDALHAAHLSGLVSGSPAPVPVRVMGIDFPNPVGLAAGLDKNGDHIDALLALGFGFIEVGAVTPRPQRGNPRPRIFRLPEAGAVINRMGFNNLGVDHLVENLRRRKPVGIVGVNIEDQVAPKRCGHMRGKELISIGEMTKKIEAGLKAKKDRTSSSTRAPTPSPSRTSRARSSA